MLNLRDPAVAIEVVENGFIIGWQEYREEYKKTGRVSFVNAVAKNEDELQEVVMSALQRYKESKPV